MNNFVIDTPDNFWQIRWLDKYMEGHKGFIAVGDWYLKMSEVKEYKPVTAEDMNPYILFKTSKFGNIKVRFPKDEDMNAELLVLDQLFDVE